ncbi:MAG TPA: flagellar basal-body rod protein FlgF [Nitrospiria bacterium]|nr:flagellar basal-body rod protein FlgF [Nitrospiria bacterium]
MDSIYPALSGALALEKRLEIISNNVANVNTTGFKRSLAIFSGLDGDRQPGSSMPPVAFETFDRVVYDYSSGPMRQTDAPLDLAIEGDGFFGVQTPEGVRYTRNGHFKMDDQGRIITSQGFPVLGGGGPITLPLGRVLVDSDGRISVAESESNGQRTEIDVLPVMVTQDPSGLVPVGESLFKASDGTAMSPAEGQILQGSLEGSNVNPVEEMVSMIQVLRLYEAAQKTINTADEAAAKASTEVGKVG